LLPGFLFRPRWDSKGHLAKWNLTGETAARDAALLLGGHADGEAEISAEEAHCARNILWLGCLAMASFGLDVFENWPDFVSELQL